MGKNTIVKDTLILLAITLISGLLLGGVFSITKDPIAAANEAAKQAAYNAVYPGGSFAEDAALNEKLAAFAPANEYGNNPAITEVLSANNGEGYVFSVNAKGYGGPVKLAVGVKADGTVTGMSVLEMGETPGLGAKCTDGAFQAQFANLQGTSLKLNEGFNQISGATITSKAVTASISSCMEFAASVQ